MVVDAYGNNTDFIYLPTLNSYPGEWSTSLNVKMSGYWNHTLIINIDTTDGYGLTCYYDMSSGTYRNEYKTFHKYDSVVTEPTKTEDGYTTHTCEVCKDQYVDSYVDALGSQGLSYEVNSDGTTCTITGIGTCEDEDIYIPSYIDGYKVTDIGEKAFDSLSDIKNIYISKTVTRINRRAFYKCSGITEIRIPENVTSIGSQIFLGCDNLATVYYDSLYAPPEGGTFFNIDSIKKIVFGDNLTKIPNYICYNCDSIEEIILSKNTQIIGDYAFYYCTSLKKIDLPNGLKNTGWYSFLGSAITSLIIPDTVTVIQNSFRDCASLEKVVFPSNLISVPDQTFYLCYNLNEVYYKGDELEWSAVSISEESSKLKHSIVYFYSENQPTKQGNYWHYVDDIPTAWESDVLIIDNTVTLKDYTIDKDVYITSAGIASFDNVTINSDIYCYGKLSTYNNCQAKNAYAYAYGSMLSCGAFDGIHGKINGSISCDNLTIVDTSLDYAFNKWGKK
jgi:hypothetical protein